MAALTAAFHVRHDLFRDKNEPLSDNADRSSIIASNIMYAAEDEFASGDRRLRLTHRLMAQELVRLCARFVGQSAVAFNASPTPSATLSDIKRSLLEGYRVLGPASDGELFRALGFHLGSERLAAIEFSTLDRFLHERFPSFVSMAEEETGPFDFPLYSWISTHTVVEVDHFEYGLLAAGMAVNTYAGAQLPEGSLLAHILEGFVEFVQFQRVMFDWSENEGAHG